MARRPSFSQSDAAKLMKAAKAAGHDTVRVEVEPGGRLVLIAGEQAARSSLSNSFDQMLGN